MAVYSVLDYTNSLVGSMWPTPTSVIVREVDRFLFFQPIKQSIKATIKANRHTARSLNIAYEMLINYIINR